MKHKYTEDQMHRAKANLLAQFIEQAEQKLLRGESREFIAFALTRFMRDIDALAVRVLDEMNGSGSVTPHIVESDLALFECIRVRYPKDGDQDGVAGEIRVSVRRILVEDGEHLDARHGEILCAQRPDAAAPTRADQVCAVAAGIIRVIADAQPFPDNGKIAFHYGERQSLVGPSPEFSADDAVNMSEFLLGFPSTK